MRKGFVLTADALFALTAIGILAMSYAAISSIQFHSQKYAGLEAQGRDYLEIAYRKGLQNFTNDSFFNLTRHNLYGGIASVFWSFDTEADERDWTPHEREWIWKDVPPYGGLYYQGGGPPDPPLYPYATAGKYYWTNYSMSALVVVQNIGVNDIAGISILANSTGGRYMCGLDYKETPPLLKLWKATNWTYPYLKEPEKEDDVVVSLDQLYRLNLSAEGTLINCSITDGVGAVVSVDLIDPARFQSGKITVERGNLNPPVGFKNISVNWGIDSPPLDAPLAVRASMLDYPWYCSCPPFSANCTINKTSPCLSQQEPLERDWILREVWVN